MGQNFAKISLGQNFKPQPTSNISNPSNGDVYYDSTRNTLVHYINGSWVDVQSRTDVATAASLTSTQLTAAVVQSSLVRLTGSTASTIAGLTAPADAKYLIIYNQSSALITVANQSGTEGTAANRIICPNSAPLTVSAGQSVTLGYDSSQSRWIVLSTPSSGSGSGGSKNYLSQYIASTGGGAQNAGNGNFELGSAAGWALGTIGTLTNGLPTGTPTFGSGASGNLSLGVVSSSQLAGLYSGSYTSSAATTQGNMLASSAFNIDAEDQAKVLTFKMYYSVPSGASNGNFSGTSSNSFGIAVWDATNSVWLPITGQFGMTQNTGVGYVTGTFQTGLTTASMNFCMYNVNATSGAITLYVDDISVGPQTAPSGPVITDWVAYTPTITGFGTPTTVKFYSRRIGDSLEIQGSFTSGITTGALAQVTLGYNGGNANVTIDSNKLSQNTLVGPAIQSSFSSTFFGVDILGVGGNNFVSFSVQTSSAGAGTPAIGTSVAANGTGVAFNAIVPITGWSSNVQMSSDTDTRVVSFRGTNSGASLGTISTSFTAMNFSAVLDTHGAWNTNTYTVPVSGNYDIAGEFVFTGTPTVANGGVYIALYVNGVIAEQYGRFSEATVLVTWYIPVSAKSIALKAGDTLQLRAEYVGTISSPAFGNGVGTANYFEISRQSGPAVVAATESVNASYQNTAGTSITTGFAAIPFATKLYDSHNAFSGSTYTIPVSGKYRISCSLFTANVTNSAAEAFQAFVTQAGSLSVTKYLDIRYGNASSIQLAITGSATFNCSAGDTIVLQATNGVATTLSTTSGQCHFEIERVGN